MADVLLKQRARMAKYLDWPPLASEWSDWQVRVLDDLIVIERERGINALHEGIRKLIDRRWPN